MKAKVILDKIYYQISADQFSSEDPISIPRQFQLKQDIEISAFFAAILAWGQRPTIIKNCTWLMEQMHWAPYDFIMNHEDRDLKVFEQFVHRTFNGTDCLYFIAALRSLYTGNDSLEHYFIGDTAKNRIIAFNDAFFSLDYAPGRTRKHIANPAKGSAAKRLNMFLRWMVRKDNTEIDFGIWKNIPSSDLQCPLDVHVRRAAMHLGLLKRKQADWKAVEELGLSLRAMDPVDPIKYDIPLFEYGKSLNSSNS
ncbi:TIGR02757 family protein [bacterium]|nr:TIGR02757 family protein [bacterium]